MIALENIKIVFSLFHDGAIVDWSGDKNKLTLKINCSYLAQRIDKTFDDFYVDLVNVKKLELDPWTKPVELPARIKTEFVDIFKAELEIMGGEIENDLVVVTCLQLDHAFDYTGGNLSVNCDAIKVYDQKKREITIEELRAISKAYWTEWKNGQN